MVVDAMLAADSHLKISESIFDPKKFLKLTDAVLEFIEHSENDVRSWSHLPKILAHYAFRSLPNHAVLSIG